MSTNNTSAEIHFLSDEEAARLTPDRRRKTPRLDGFAAALQANPGKWAAIPLRDGITPRYRTEIASKINNHSRGAPAALRHGFEAAWDGDVIVARYVGDDQ